MNVIYYQTMGLTMNDKLERISKAVVMIYFKLMQCVSGLRFKYRDTPAVQHVSITQLLALLFLQHRCTYCVKLPICMNSKYR
jgi:hypothetical protein